jgi:hypothetical protein
VKHIVLDFSLLRQRPKRSNLKRKEIYLVLEDSVQDWLHPVLRCSKTSWQYEHVVEEAAHLTAARKQKGGDKVCVSRTHPQGPPSSS